MQVDIYLTCLIFCSGDTITMTLWKEVLHGADRLAFVRQQLEDTEPPVIIAGIFVMVKKHLGNIYH
jgi:hypothetical protein